MVSGSLIFDLLRQLPRMAHCWPRSFSANADYVLARSHLCHLAVARETQEVSGPAAAWCRKPSTVSVSLFLGEFHSLSGSIVVPQSTRAGKGCAPVKGGINVEFRQAVFQEA